jgi:predicted enzyme related to lactoylglutathione lyase
MEPLFRAIDCIRIPVPSLEAGLAFYRDQLGHDLLWHTEDQAGLRLPETASEIVLYTEPLGMEVDFLVDSVDEAAARFDLAGGRVVTPPFDIPIGRCAVVEDPFGNEMVILDMSKGRLITDEAGNVIGVENDGPDGERLPEPK